METEKQLNMVEFTLPLSLIDAVTPFLAEHCPYGWQEADSEDNASGTIILYFDDPVAAADVLRELKARWPEVEPETASLENCQWATSWKRFFTPIEISDTFLVLPPWLADQETSLQKILIEPQMAFGTGHHATTALCMQAIVSLVASGKIRAGERFLDAGTGSGILGITCAKLGLEGFGFDLDPLTLDNIQLNRRLNGITQGFTAFVGSIDLVDPAPGFRLILANILAAPLIDLAPELTRRLIPGGCLVLSGLLREQIEDVTLAYQACGLGEPAVLFQREWACLIFG